VITTSIKRSIHITADIRAVRLITEIIIVSINRLTGHMAIAIEIIVGTVQKIIMVAGMVITNIMHIINMITTAAGMSIITHMEVTAIRVISSMTITIESLITYWIRSGS